MSTLNDLILSQVQTISESLKTGNQNTNALYDNFKQFEGQPGFFSCLMTIFANENYNYFSRMLSAILFKNAVERNWRPRSPTPVSSEEKEHLRTNLLGILVQERNPPIYNILREVLSRITRMDWPRQWNGLIAHCNNNIMQSLNNDLLRGRHIAMFATVVKSISSNSLPIARQTYNQVAGEIFEYIMNVWKILLSQSHTSYSKEQTNCCKILRCLLCYGFKDSESEIPVNSVFELVFHNLTLFENQWQQAKTNEINKVSNEVDIDDIEVTMKSLLKLISEVLRFQPFTLVHVLEKTINFVVEYLAADKPHVHKSYAISCLNLLNSIIIERKYNTELFPDDIKTQTAHHTIRSTLSDNVLLNLFPIVIQRYMMMTLDEVEDLDANAEEAVWLDEDLAEFQVQNSAEQLVKTLVSVHTQLLIPSVQNMLVSISSAPCDGTDMQQVLVRDAVFCAVGLTCYDLFKIVNFEELCAFLFKDLQIAHPNFKVIRRRVSWVIREWIDLVSSSAIYPQLFDVLVRLHHPNEALIVRLQATQALANVVDSVYFNLEDFRPYLQESISQVFQLIAEVESSQCKLNVLDTIIGIVSRSKTEIRPYCADIAAMMPDLWSCCGDDNLLRSKIVILLTCIVERSSPTESTKMNESFLSIVQLSVDPSQDAFVYLYDDGLVLWKAILRMTMELTPALAQMFPHALLLLDKCLDSTEEVFDIIQLYLLTSPQLAQNHAAVFSEVCLHSFKNLRVEAHELVIKLMDLLLVYNGEESAAMLYPVFVAVAMNVLVAEDEYERSVHCGALARLAVSSFSTFEKVITQVNQTQPGTNILHTLCKCWFDQLQKEKSFKLAMIKVSCFALFTCLSHGIPDVVNSLPYLITSAMKFSIQDCLVALDIEPDEEDSPATIRERNLRNNDILYKVSVTDYLVETLQRLKHYEPETFQSLYPSLDAELQNRLS